MGAKLQPVIALSSAEAEYYGMVSGVQRALAIQSLLEEFNIPTKVIVRTDSMAAKQSVEKVGLLHVKHMAMRMLFLKDLQRAGVIVIEKIAGSMNPADMFTKPLSAPDFVKCKGRIPGIYWGDDENENDASKENEAEVQMIEMMETNPAEVYGKKAQFRDTLLNFASAVGECAKLALATVGALALARHQLCPVRRKSTREVQTQSQCTYTFLRGVQIPRFLPLDENRHGAFLKLVTLMFNAALWHSRRSVGIHASRQLRAKGHTLTVLGRYPQIAF